jgi:4-hydroxy-2-oxoheptanedioate aldolase
VTNPVRERLRAGEATLGCFTALGSPNVAELLGHAGFEWLVIEMEHGGLGMAEVERMLMAVSGTGAVPLVRVPSSAAGEIQRVLDLGARGVVVPMVGSPAEAAMVVSATRYPPAGSRSFGPLRAARYSLDYEEYLRTANDETIVALIVETAGAVAELDAIAAVPGVDVLYFGLFDLCLAFGLDPHQLPHPGVDDVIDRALRAGVEHGVAIGIGVRGADELRARRAQGFRFVGYGTDYFMLLDAARQGIEAFE